MTNALRFPAADPAAAASFFAAKGALALAQRGYRVKRLAGGITAWREAGYPIESDAHSVVGVSKVACHC
ncbi:rhodanese-like domain-containing protein [Lentzea atacamensis]|nr:hypothetical protein [Lentzea atacamensis]